MTALYIYHQAVGFHGLSGSAVGLDHAAPVSNVASTRLVLIEGHTRPDAADKVVEAFGRFLIGGNYTVGIVVVVILTVIDFTMVTKGAGRIAEVGAL